MGRITREERRRALLEDYKNRGKGERHWYIKDGSILEEEYGIKMFTPDEGNVFLAILERKESPKFFLELSVHYNIGPDNHAFLCLDKMFGKECPICNYREELKQSGEPEDIYNTFRYTRRYLMWVVNIETPRTVKEGVYLYDAPMTVKNGILDACVDPRSGEIIDPSDPEENVNVVFKRIGKRGYQRTEYKGFKLEEREDEIPEEYYDLPPMEDLLIEPNTVEIKRCLGISTRRKERIRDEDVDIEEIEEVEEEEVEGEIFDEENIESEESEEFEVELGSNHKTEEEEKEEILERTRRRLSKVGKKPEIKRIRRRER